MTAHGWISHHRALLTAKDRKMCRGAWRGGRGPTNCDFVTTFSDARPTKSGLGGGDRLDEF